MADERFAIPIDANTLSQWMAEATAERRRAGLKNPHAFRVQVLIEEVERLREEQRARTVAAETLEKQLAEVRDRLRSKMQEILDGEDGR